ncbi:hypothetical protein K438DRAFT_1839908 [Mycena galopus ATCC 62051]|nr:hypothetical protein K438DRAFT_1839908 [Mycena galopus ATCC 62051]
MHPICVLLPGQHSSLRPRTALRMATITRMKTRRGWRTPPSLRINGTTPPSLLIDCDAPPAYTRMWTGLRTLEPHSSRGGTGFLRVSELELEADDKTGQVLVREAETTRTRCPTRHSTRHPSLFCALTLWLCLRFHRFHRLISKTKLSQRPNLHRTHDHYDHTLSFLRSNSPRVFPFPFLFPFSVCFLDPPIFSLISSYL